MPLTPFVPYVAAAYVLSVLAILWAAASNSHLTALISAALYTCFLSGLTLYISIPYWKAGATPPDGEPAVSAGHNNARLMSMTYAWGALAISAAYYMTDLHWYHAWQYAAIMLLVGGALAGYAHLISDKDHVLRKPKALNFTAILAALQAIGALGGVILMVSSGKLGAGKSDWVANVVFLFGGLAIIAISSIAVATHFRIRMSE